MHSCVNFFLIMKLFYSIRLRQATSLKLSNAFSHMNSSPLIKLVNSHHSNTYLSTVFRSLHNSPEDMHRLNAVVGNRITKDDLNPDIETDIDRTNYLYGVDIKENFSNLGFKSSEILQCLTIKGFDHATSIQAKAIPAILSGADIVIGAETGSGKTLTYLLPLLDQCLQYKKSSAVIKNENVEISEEPILKKKKTSYPLAVILVPNKELCNQVFDVADSLCQSIEGQFQPKVDKINYFSGYRWPFATMDPELAPDILICTPSFLFKFTRGQNAFDEDLFGHIKHLVLDEADMLLDGAYLDEIDAILDEFKLSRRQKIRNGQLEVNDHTVQHVLSAATIPTMGLRSIESYIKQRFPLAKRITHSYLHCHHPRIQQSFIRVRGDSPLSDERISALVEAIMQPQIPDPALVKAIDSSEAQEQELTAIISPAPVVVASNFAGDELSDIIESVKELNIPSTMVFVNTAATARTLTQRLLARGIPCNEFHKLVHDINKSSILEDFRNSLTKVLICTDSAARGLDLPNVKHVIQADFALNVVQHQHRIGRSSRAGSFGYATNFYGDGSVDLVDSILSDREANTVQQSFSRRRGFRAKIKKNKKLSLEI